MFTNLSTDTQPTLLSTNKALWRVFLCLVFSLLLQGCPSLPVQEQVPAEVILDAGTTSDTTPDTGVLQERDIPERIGNKTIKPVNDREYLPVLLDMLALARSSIRISQLSLYEGTPTGQIEKALAAAHARGVTVRVLLEDSVAANPGAVRRLKKAGVDAKVDSPKKMSHLKLVIVDDLWVLVGSTNWSTSSLQYNHETNVLIQSPDIVSFFVNYHQLLWGNSSSSILLNSVQSDGIQAYREGQYTSLVLPLFQKAKKEIRIMLYALVTYTSAAADASRLVEALAEAVKRGVKVRVLLEQSDWNADLNQKNLETARALKRLSINVCFDPRKVISHSKLVLVDQTYYVVGTNNWSRSGLSLNHEVGVVVKSDPGQQTFHSYFEDRWRECTPVP